MMKLLRRFRTATPPGARSERLPGLVAEADRANASRDWATAAERYREALAIDPSLSALWIQLGHADKEQGFLDGAANSYRQAVALEPRSAEGHLQLGHLLRLQGAHGQAVDAYDAARVRSARPFAAQADLDAARRDAALATRDRISEQDLDRLATARGNDVDRRAIRALLERHGIGSAFLALFDAYLYRQLNPQIRAAVEPGDLMTCLAHFCAAGIDAGLPFHDHWTFDPQFYRSTYLSGMPFTTGNAYRHWLCVGLRQHATPNRERWLDSVFGTGSAAIGGLDARWPVAVRDPAADQLADTTLLLRYAADAWDPRLPVPEDPHAVAGLLGAADRHERLAALADTATERDHEAFRAFAIRQRLVRMRPDLAANRRCYGRALLDRGCHAEALIQFEALTDTDGEPLDTYLDKARCEEQLGSYREMLETLRRGRQRWPGDPRTERHLIDGCTNFAGLAWEWAMGEARTGEIEKGRQRVAQAAAMVAGLLKLSGRVPSRAIRQVALVANMGLPQCRLYRVDQRREQLERTGYDVSVFDHETDLGEFLGSLHRLQAAIFFRVPAHPAIVQAMEGARAAGIITFYEIDDLIFDEAHYPDPPRTYSSQLPLDEHHGLALATGLFKQALRLCDHAIASTTSLAERMFPHVPGRTFVIRNGIGEAHRRAMRVAATHRKVRSGGSVTLLCGSGTLAHKMDFRDLLEPALVEIGRRHAGKVRIVLIGPFQPGPELLATPELVLMAGTGTIEEYWELLSDADINLSVLADTVAAGCKSEIKWLEAAMFGIPSIVSATATHREVVRHGENGLLCQTTEEWIEALELLIGNPALRVRMGRQAYDQAIRQYSPERLSETVRDVMTAVSPEDDIRPVLLIVNVFFPPQTIGGATRIVGDTVRMIARHHGERYRVVVFTTLDRHQPYEMQVRAWEGVQVIGVGASERHDVDQATGDARMGVLFADLLVRLKPGIVHFHCIQRIGYEAVDETRKSGIPYIISMHDAWWISDHQFTLDQDGRSTLYDYSGPPETSRHPGMLASRRMSELREPLFAARQILAVSDSFAELLRRCGLERVGVVRNGITSLPAGPRTPSADGHVRLGFVSGMARHKGYDLVRIALRSHSYRRLRLLVIDHDMKAGETRRERWGTVEIDFRPRSPPDAMGSVYGELDVLLAPSVWPESFGLSTREALACGCWVIASDRGDIGAPVEHGRNGFRIGVGTPDPLVTVLKQIDDHPENYRFPPKGAIYYGSLEEQSAAFVAAYDRALGSPLTRK